MVLTETPAVERGTPAPDFSLTGTDGTIHTLTSCRGPDGLVVMFICNHCPYVRAIRDRLVDDMRELHALGIGVVAINSNDADSHPDDDLAHMQAQAAEWGFCFPYLRDETQDVARAFGAVCTPDFFGYDRELKLAYRGRLDAGGHGPRLPGMRCELVEAMAEIAACGETRITQQPSMGCSIKWKTHGAPARPAAGAPIGR
jgi:peroxiredoxin